MDFSQVKADAELAVTEIENLNQVVGDVVGMKFKSHNSSSSDFCFIVVRVLGSFGRQPETAFRPRRQDR